MSNYEFRPAVRENVGLLIGLAGGTGSGKTFTAMRLAAGIAGNKPFVLLDTEARRGLHYADRFKFDHCEIKPPFRPKAYEDAIVAADGAGYGVIVVDSMSHVWAGSGGVLDWQEEELEDMVARALKRKTETRAEWQIREAVKMAAWIKPKTAHKHMMSRLLQVRAHLILAFRAEEKIEMRKGKDNKVEIVPKETLSGFKGWIPICEKSLPFELTASLLLTADAPGVPKPIKVQQQHVALFPPDKPITEESGRLIAEWAAGGKAKPATTQTPESARTGTEQSATPSASSATPSSGEPVYITEDEELALVTRCEENSISLDKLREKAGVKRIALIETKDYAKAVAWIDAILAARKARQAA